MVECEECGKRLGFFEGYNHPTLGKKSLVCRSCFDTIQQSVEQWRDFVLSNSFNNESSAQTLNIDWSSIFKRIAGVQKPLKKVVQTQSPRDTLNLSHSKMTMNHLNCNSSDLLVYHGTETL